MPEMPQRLEADAEMLAGRDALNAAHRENKGVLFYGPPGNGKSTVLAEFAAPMCQKALPHMTWRLRHHWLDREAIWSQAAEFIDDCKHEIDLAKRKDFDDFSDDFSASGIAKRVPVLFLDDLGTESATPFCREIVEKLIDTRYRSRSKLITHFTCNLTISELAQRYSERAVSRLSEMCVFLAFSGVDRRLAKIRR